MSEPNPEALKLLKKGMSLWRRMRARDAILCFDDSIKIDPDFAYAWFNKSIALGQCRQFDEAIACCERAIEINPNYAEAWACKGWLLGEIGRCEEVIACCDRAIEINPHCPEAWACKIQELGKLGRKNEQLDCIDRAIEAKPGFAIANLIKDGKFNGMEIADLGWNDELLPKKEQPLEEERPQYLKYLEKATVLKNMGQIEDAIAWYDRIIEIESTNYGVWNFKGMALTELGRCEEAIACHERAIEINPNSEIAWASKGTLLRRSGQFKEALVCFEETKRLGSTSAEIEIEQCRTLMTSYDPDSADWQGIGLLGTMGMVDEAVACYNLEIERNPGNAKAWHDKGYILMNPGFNEIMMIYPESFRRSMGWRPENERIEEALICFEEAKRLGDKNSTEWITECKLKLSPNRKSPA